MNKNVLIVLSYDNKSVYLSIPKLYNTFRIIKGVELWMSDWIPPINVNQYLIRIKEAITKGRYEYVGSRKENIDSLAKAGLLPTYVKEYILGLTYLDYFNGPEEEKIPGIPKGNTCFLDVI